MRAVPVGIRGDVALVDDDDAEFAMTRRWILSASPSSGGIRYAYTKDGRKYVGSLHRLLMAAKPGQVIDHINGDGLDNRRQNLRLATPGQNRQNSRAHRGHSSAFKGVCWNRASCKWQASIKVRRSSIYLGLFLAEEEAARAYDAAAALHFGEFARLNFTKQEETA